MEKIGPKEMAKRVSKLLKTQSPDKNYLKKTFEYVREELSLKGKIAKSKKLPVLLTEDEMKRFYEAVWYAQNRIHMIIIKLLFYTGIRNSELVSILLEDIDLDGLRIKICEGKGAKDRYVLFPPSFKGEFAQYVFTQKEKNVKYLFETNRKNKYTTRWVREIVKRYANKAGINKRIYPHLFRHQLLTYLTQSGIVDAKIQLISGHSNRESLSVYQDLSLKDVEREYHEAMKNFPV